MGKTVKLVVIVSCIVLLTGCWDKIEIEQRSFVYGIAIDLSENHSNGNSEITLTQQFVIPENLTTTSTAGGKGPPYQNISANGNTIFEINRAVMREANLKTDVTHLKVVLFSEELAKEPMHYEEFLDVFLREKDMRRGIQTAITTGDAEEFLSIAPENEKVPAQYISELLDNPQKFEVLDLTVIGDLQEKMFNEESIPLPLLDVIEKDKQKLIEYEGISVYNGKKHQVVGELKGNAAKGLSFIRGKRNTGTINVTVDNKVSTFVILDLKERITLKNKEKNHLTFNVDMDIKVEIAEQYGKANLLDQKVINKFEKEIEKRVEYKMNLAIDQLQKDLQTDILGLSSYLSRYHPKLWKEIKDDWEQGEYYFVKSEIQTNVNATIDRPGNVNRTTVGGGK